MAQSPLNNPWSFAFCRLAGYGLLSIALINGLDAFIPFYWSDTSWKFNTCGILIERMPVILMGFVLVFLGSGELRSRWDRLLLKGLSWSALGVGVVFLLMVPLLFRSAMTIDTRNTAEVNVQYRQQIRQIDQIEQLVGTATEAQLNSFIIALKAQSQTFSITDPTALRQQVTQEVIKARKTALKNRQSQEASQRLSLRKTVLRWNLSALVSAFLFFAIWRMTTWARRSNKVLSAMAQAREQGSIPKAAPNKTAPNKAAPIKQRDTL